VYSYRKFSVIGKCRPLLLCAIMCRLHRLIWYDTKRTCFKPRIPERDLNIHIPFQSIYLSEKTPAPFDSLYIVFSTRSSICHWCRTTAHATWYTCTYHTNAIATTRPLIQGPSFAKYVPFKNNLKSLIYNPVVPERGSWHNSLTINTSSFST